MAYSQDTEITYKKSLPGRRLRAVSFVYRRCEMTENLSKFKTLHTYLLLFVQKNTAFVVFLHKMRVLLTPRKGRKE